MNFGATELILVVGIALLIFGPSKLPALGKSVGQAIKGFKQSLNSPEETDRTDDPDKKV